MSRAYEKGIQRAQQAVASVGQRPERTEPRSRAEVESFIKGFGLSAPAVRQIVDEWCDDQQHARDAGWESHADSVWYDG
jgi:hypothetical protein